MWIIISILKSYKLPRDKFNTYMQNVRKFKVLLREIKDYQHKWRERTF